MITKKIALQSRFLDCCPCKQGHTSGSSIAKIIFWRNDFCKSYKDNYKRECLKELFCIRSEKKQPKHRVFGRDIPGHPGPRRRDIPGKNFMQVAFFCCFRQGVAGMCRDLGRDVPDLEKLYARKLWADFSFPIVVTSAGMVVAYVGNFRQTRAGFGSFSLFFCWLLGHSRWLADLCSFLQ